ncbi:hypothetical protein B296_00054170 [Ensete ventricosum]|uniref:Uncharacterized protein n=1 Tax=Ensete ventricosum TaxID=4639 RepID=A0A426XEZ4_ENSVE|nr:hypothetical protein B296_00054170 [Ensete ventricosum]
MTLNRLTDAVAVALDFPVLDSHHHHGGGDGGGQAVFHGQGFLSRDFVSRRRSCLLQADLNILRSCRVPPTAKDVDLESMSMNQKEGDRSVVNRSEDLMMIDFGGDESLAKKERAIMLEPQVRQKEVVVLSIMVKV